MDFCQTRISNTSMMRIGRYDVIRKVKSFEAGLLSDLALRSKAFWNYSPGFIDACRPALLITEEVIQRGQYWLLEQDHVIVGFYGLEELSAKVVELAFLFIDPLMIGKGAGKQLFEHAVKLARKFGYTQIRIESDPNATGFYLAMGARLVGDAPSTVMPNRQLPLLYLDVMPDGTEEKLKEIE